VYSLSIGDKSGDLGWTSGYFPGEQNISTTDISHTCSRSATKFGNVGGLANRNLFPEFRELWSRDPVASTCISSLHWCTCKVVFRQLPYVYP